MASFFAPLGGGVAVADPAVQEQMTSQGYRLKLSLDDVTIQSVPNMAAAPLVREGYVTATAKLEIKCPEPKEPEKDCAGTKKPGIVGSYLTLAAQVGCQEDLNTGISLAPNATVDAGVPGIGLGQLLPNDPTDITNIGIAPTVNSDIGALEVKIRPGSITDFALGDISTPAVAALGPLKGFAEFAKDLQGRLALIPDPAEKQRAGDQIAAIGKGIQSVLNRRPEDGMVVSVLNRHIVVDRRTDKDGNTWGACAGPVAIRMFASAVVTTATTVDNVHVFSDIRTL